VYASAQKAAREALRSLNWPPKQTKEHKYEYKQKGGRDRGDKQFFQGSPKISTRFFNNSLNWHLNNSTMKIEEESEK